ncbi:MAG: TauD/TfdA dioxygenase family protein [Rhizobiaceae bacterium]
MATLDIRPLQDDLPFGARIGGVTRDSLKDEDVRAEINRVFEDRGMIVFEGIESSSEMQVLLSNVFGPLKDHPVKTVERVDQEKMPGVISIRTGPNAHIVEIEGKQLMSWQPWHFDHSYNNELNRAGVLRAEVVPPEDGITAFTDGIQIWNDLDPESREELDGLEIVYTLDLRYSQQWFGLPLTFKEIKPKGEGILEVARALPRAIHPAVWQRQTGEKVVHLSPYGAQGILGQETPEGKTKLVELWDKVETAMKTYHHTWKPDDMLVWDNWRMLHKACGVSARYERIMHRTTIKGDYGLGRWEEGAPAAGVLSGAM